jgi:hypothetical protein
MNFLLLPGHYFLEGMIMSQFANDESLIEATPGSPFYLSLVEEGECTEGQEGPCEGTIGQWIDVSFTDWNESNVKWNALYLAGLIILSRLITFYALTNINYRAT